MEVHLPNYMLQVDFVSILKKITENYDPNFVVWLWHKYDLDRIVLSYVHVLYCIQCVTSTN